MSKDTVEFYRMKIEWARIEPEEGLIDESAILSYRREIRKLKKDDGEVLLTIYDFENPDWFEEKGAFNKKQNVDDFLHYVSVVMRAFGDLVEKYVTIDESRYFFLMGRQEMSILAFCHIRAYEKIHRMRNKMGFSNTEVGILKPGSVQGTKEKWIQKMMDKACMEGKFILPLSNYGKLESGKYCDFFE